MYDNLPTQILFPAQFGCRRAWFSLIILASAKKKLSKKKNKENEFQVKKERTKRVQRLLIPISEKILILM